MTQRLHMNEIQRWLRATDVDELQALWDRADAVRRDAVGEDVHLRGLVEISNYCARQCHYCGLRAENRAVRRYRMSHVEIVAAAVEARQLGYGTVVLQAGEDFGLTTPFITAVVRDIKRTADLAVTLSLGERGDEALEAWRAAGADRYLLRFETSNPALFARIHPPLGGVRPVDRLELLRKLDRLGYEVGSGVMIGIPGQTYADLARDIALFAELNLDMIGVGPFIPHPDTPLGQQPLAAAPDEQVPNTELMTYKVLALARLIRPYANIPSTTALATLNRAQGRELGLMRGANIVMPNVTPVRYRCSYEVYPDKACLQETAAQCEGCLKSRIRRIGRGIGVGRGNSQNYERRHAAPASADLIGSVR